MKTPAHPSACTIISRNYLSHARILAESYLRHHPGANFYLLVVDGLPKGIRPGNRIKQVLADELALPYFFEMCLKYDVTELCTAVKPTLLWTLMEKYDEPEIVYLDPDILILRTLNELRAALDRSDIVLTPHLLEPIPLDGKRPSEQDVLIAGAHNLGFLGLRRSEETKRFIDWWESRLRDGCRVDPANGLMVDQRWVDLVPTLFPSAGVLRDETYNVAYWNLHSRPLDKDGNGFQVHGRRLTFFHFSGFDPRKPNDLSKHQNRTEVIPGSALHTLLNKYVNLQQKKGFQECASWSYGYSTWGNGMAIDPITRRLYLGLDEQTRQAFGNPFDSEEENAFLNWAVSSQDELGGLSPFLTAIHRDRYDVSAAFRDVTGEDREEFIEWARTKGAKEMGYNPALAEVNLGSGTLSGGIGRTSPKRIAVNRPIEGVNVCGYLSDESGLGSLARRTVNALRSAGLKVALTDISDLSPNRSMDGMERAAQEPTFDVNIMFINADQHFVVLSHLGKEFFEGRYNIGVWHWELPRFPEKWQDRFPYYDEIWASSNFIASSLASVSPIPVVRIPPVLTVERQRGRRSRRTPFHFADQEFVFLFIFDFHSYFKRKNPLTTIQAFKQAFAASDPVRLVVKSVNADFNRAGYLAMKKAAKGYPISLFDGYWSKEDIDELVARCDAYVSLHRSEGAGLTIADAMARGKPVIATGWSGNMDFMNFQNSFLIPYTKIAIDENEGPYQAGEMWAEPSVDEAAKVMRLVLENPQEARKRARRAKHEIEMNFSQIIVGELMLERLRRIESYRGANHSSAALFETDEYVNYPKVIAAIREVVEAVVPKDANVLVVSKGDAKLLQLDGRLAHHFPQTKGGTYAGHHPADSASAITHLEELIAQGAGYILFPKTSLWWLDHYFEFRDHLESRHRRIVADESCTIYALQRHPRSEDGGMAIVPTRLDLPAASSEHGAQMDERYRYLERSIDKVRSAQESTNKLLAEIAGLMDLNSSHLEARPFMANDIFGALKLEQPLGYGLDAAGPWLPPGGIPFEELFRGSEALITESQRVYLQFFEGSERVVDLGCGRGEFLTLLEEIGVTGVGVDHNSEMVASCKELGLNVMERDAIDYLRGLDEQSLDGVFCARLFEYMESHNIAELLALAKTRLRPGGTFISETVNPENYQVLKTFHVDLTRQKPIFPQALLHMCMTAGFATARIFYPRGGGFKQVNYSTAVEYAVIARAT